MQHFICSPETTTFCFVAENIVMLPNYPEDNLSPLELVLLDFARNIGEGIVVARLVFPGQGPFSEPEVNVFGSALSRRNAPFAARSPVRLSWTDTSFGSPPQFPPVELLMDTESLVSLASLVDSPSPSSNIIPWSEWGRAARRIPGMKYRYGSLPMNPTRQAVLEIKHLVVPSLDPSLPGMNGKRLTVSKVQVIEFGRMGSSGQDAGTPMTRQEIMRDPVAPYLSSPLLDDIVVPLMNTLRVDRCPQKWGLREYVTLCDEERIVVLEVSTIVSLPVISSLLFRFSRS